LVVGSGHRNTKNACQQACLHAELLTTVTGKPVKLVLDKGWGLRCSLSDGVVILIAAVLSWIA